jgi:hypothetical protein
VIEGETPRPLFDTHGIPDKRPQGAQIRDGPAFAGVTGVCGYGLTRRARLAVHVQRQAVAHDGVLPEVPGLVQLHGG